MKPFAISQIVEQIARVFYMLLATFIIMRVVEGDYTAAVTQSTFAAFIGVLASVLVLVYYFQKQRVRMDVLLDMSKEETEIQTKEIGFIHHQRSDSFYYCWFWDHNFLN